MVSVKELLGLQNRYGGGGKDDSVYPVVLKKKELLDTTTYEEISREVRGDGTILVYCYRRDQGDSFVGHASKKSE